MTKLSKAALDAVASALRKRTQEEVARDLDVSLATVSRWARRLCAPKGGAARRVLAALTGASPK